jgi:hypothetical protein
MDSEFPAWDSLAVDICFEGSEIREEISCAAQGDERARESYYTGLGGRTFPHRAFFTDGQGIGQENLFNVLKAYSS